MRYGSRLGHILARDARLRHSRHVPRCQLRQGPARYRRSRRAGLGVFHPFIRKDEAAIRCDLYLSKPMSEVRAHDQTANQPPSPPAWSGPCRWNSMKGLEAPSLSSRLGILSPIDLRRCPLLKSRNRLADVLILCGKTMRRQHLENRPLREKL